MDVAFYFIGVLCLFFSLCVLFIGIKKESKLRKEEHDRFIKLFAETFVRLLKENK